jgi:hypothetical protein
LVDVNLRIAETTKETDRRLEEVNRRITETAKETDRRLGQVDRRITETADDSKSRFDEVGRRLSGVEATNLELRHQMAALNVTFQRGSFAIVASVLGVIAAILAKGG